MRILAPAKLNLYLHVLDRRGDGFHRLDSLIVFTELHDTLDAEQGRGLTLEVGGPAGRAIAGEEENIVLTASRSLAAAAGVPADARLRLEKRIPVAAGLGGGSADAAATLRALADLWNLPETFRPGCPDSRLPEIALRLGADVPVCLAGTPSFVGGIGEAIEAAPGLPPVDLVLVNPSVRLSTRSVFRLNRVTGSATARFDRSPKNVEELADWLRSRRNDLVEAAVRIAPVVRHAIAELERREGCLLARMSGSGASCFGLFADEGAAGRAAESIRRARSGWWVEATRTLS